MSDGKKFFRASAEDFRKIPGNPIAYWLLPHEYDIMELADKAAAFGDSKQGLITSDNNRFLRLWHEISLLKIGKKWFHYNKGGGFRKWFGYREYVVNWENDGYEIRNLFDDKGKLLSRPQNIDKFFTHSLTWSDISSAPFAMRDIDDGFIFDASGPSFFPFNPTDTDWLLAAFNSCLTNRFLKVIAPGMHYSTGHIPLIPIIKPSTQVQSQSLTSLSRIDWNSYETSWDFEVNPLVAMRQNPVNPVNPVEKSGQLSVASGQEEKTTIATAHCTLPTDHSSLTTAHSSLAILYAALRRKWAESCEEMRRLETENNRIFIEAYGLQDELTPDVPWNEITLTCNPWYRYGVRSEECGVRSEELPRDTALEERLKGDTVKELVSYAVGCMMGRYSLDKPGLILADQGATIADYCEKVGSGQCSVASGERSGQWSVISDQKGDTTLPTAHCPLPTDNHFVPDEDGIIPILDNDWFADDIVTRFKEFIKVAFGEEHYLENIAWIEDVLGKDIRSYFTKDFYKDHLQRYQNRPIYWLFQSPKGAFRALVYMHRYKPDMVGGVLGYLRSLQTKIDNQLDVAMQVGADESKSASERVRANKDAVKYAKAKKELDEYEKNVLYPLSTERIEIDLDDGVKVNYRKFGSALRKVAALEG